MVMLSKTFFAMVVCNTTADAPHLGMAMEEHCGSTKTVTAGGLRKELFQALLHRTTREKEVFSNNAQPNRILPVMANGLS
jgi:hypothetical protein